VIGNRLCSIQWFVFLRFLLLLLWGPITFSILIHFWSFSVHQIGGVQVLFGHQKQRSPPLGYDLPWALKWLLMGCSTLVTPPHTKVPACLYDLLRNLGPSDLNLQKMVYPPFAFYLLFEWILSPRFGVSLDWYAILCHYLRPTSNGEPDCTTSFKHRAHKCAPSCFHIQVFKTFSNGDLKTSIFEHSNS
jgi:hypothetical protein